jgi:hypothetical protein
MSALSKVEMSVSAPFWEFGDCHFDGLPLEFDHCFHELRDKRYISSQSIKFGDNQGGVETAAEQQHAGRL